MKPGEVRTPPGPWLRYLPAIPTPGRVGCLHPQPYSDGSAMVTPLALAPSHISELVRVDRHYNT